MRPRAADLDSVPVGVHDDNVKSFQHKEVTAPKHNDLAGILSQITANHPDLAIVIAIWPKLSDEIRSAVLKIIT
jgi:hypothetical protein